MYEGSKESLLHQWVRISPKVRAAFRAVPRELFVPRELKQDAYEDVPLPIAAGQTISQPTTVVLMLDALNVRAGNNVLEVGAGSGYNAALLGTLVGPKGRVTSVEVQPMLVRKARQNLKAAGIKNVDVVLADGSLGYRKNAPYDRIVGACAAPMIPETWFSQLKEKGVIVVPVGSPLGQRMMRVQKTDGRPVTKYLGQFSFVPMVGEIEKK